MAPQRPGLHVQPGQLSAQAIVQITPQTPPLLLPRRHQSLARALQIVGKPHRAHRHLGLPGEVLQQAAVGVRKSLPPRPRGEHQAPDLFPLVYERQDLRFVSRRTVRCGSSELPVLFEQYSHVG
jgi:hypothetical protein